MKYFHLYHDHIGLIGYDYTYRIYEYTDAVSRLHSLVREYEDWLEEFPKGKWSVELCDDTEDTRKSNPMYTLTTAKIKKLQTQNLF